ncbi:hypothetical protein CHUAL_007255 [Chamberlinius hualienensis]
MPLGRTLDGYILNHAEEVLTVPLNLLVSTEPTLEEAQEVSERYFEDRTIYQFFVWLPGGKPECYRRVQIPSTSSFYKFHLAIQSCFKWKDWSLHHFEKFTRFPDFYEWIGYPIEQLDGERFTHSGQEKMIKEYFVDLYEECQYVYHVRKSAPYIVNIQLESIFKNWDDDCYPICIDGRMPNPTRPIGNKEYYKAYTTIAEDGSHSFCSRFSDSGFDVGEIVFDENDSELEMKKWCYALAEDGLLQWNGRKPRAL